VKVFGPFSSFFFYPPAALEDLDADPPTVTRSLFEVLPCDAGPGFFCAVCDPKGFLRRVSLF